jgi:hypothetical protein
MMHETWLFDEKPDDEVMLGSLKFGLVRKLGVA